MINAQVKKDEEPKALYTHTPMPEFKPFQAKKFSTIYPIQLTCMNQSSSFLALGLKDGSTLVWDVNYEQESGYPEKFRYCPTVMQFVNDNILVLGSSEN